MRQTIVFLAVAAAPISAALTFIVRRVALTKGMLDVPNTRSSHVAPTPRGGGLAIVLTSSIGFALLARLHVIDGSLLLGLLWALPVGVVGWLDDRRPLPAWCRLPVHVAAAIWATFWLGKLPPIRWGDHVISLGAAGYVLTIPGIVWTLNLFNFMDGIDGIAASEAAFVSFAGGLLMLGGASTLAVAGASVLFGAACVGFLVWNFPRAKIFMGDVGSGYLGYVIAILALAAARSSGVALFIWLILSGAFFVDATVTLARRALRGERLHEAHRSHAYQRIAGRWASHKRTTVAVVILNVLWLLPWAWLAGRYPSLAAWFTLIALSPIVGLAVVAGAGGRETAVARQALP